MKLLKSIIPLFVLASLGLSVIPLTTAQAASNTIKVQNTLNDSSKKSLDITYEANNKADTATSTGTAKPVAASAALPVAESADTTTTNADDGAHSDVSVTVLSGILTLEAVPNFNFGTIMQGSTGKLKNNTVDTTGYNSTDQSQPITAGEDGNSQGLLEVIDSRNSGKTMPGFDLSASMGPLRLSDSEATEDNKIDAILNLNPAPMLDGDKNNVSTSSTDLNTQKVALNSKEGNSASVMNLQPGTYNAGLISSTFNTPDSASLELLGSGTGTEKSSMKMNAVITWTLSTNPSPTTN